MPLHLAVNDDRLIVSSYGFMFCVKVRAAGWRTSLSSISLARWRAQRDSKFDAQKLDYPKASGAWWNVFGERAPALTGRAEKLGLRRSTDNGLGGSLSRCSHVRGPVDGLLRPSGYSTARQPP